MVTILLLIVIYLAFISLGLPDSILGSALPAMVTSWNLPLSAGGLVSLITVGGTIISSFTAGYLLKRISTGMIVFISCLMTGSALLGFSYAPAFSWLLVLALPLGLGAGAVDTALNSYVALHFKAQHMNWLHSFWGVGATLGPVIMSRALLAAGSWQTGYRFIAFLQLILAHILFLSLPLWSRHRAAHTPGTANESADAKNSGPIPGVPFALATMLFYCAAEMGVGLWASSFLVKARGFVLTSAAGWAAAYYGGITAGRFLAGFVSERLGNRRMIQVGCLVSAGGLLLLHIPLPGLFIGAALVLTGLGFAPIYPAMIHATPERFGAGNAPRIIGFQMGFAYIGSALFPPLTGLLFQSTSLGLFPSVMFILTTGVLVLSETLERTIRR